jgi:hypothetical protein
VKKYVIVNKKNIYDIQILNPIKCVRILKSKKYFEIFGGPEK